MMNNGGGTADICEQRNAFLRPIMSSGGAILLALVLTGSGLMMAGVNPLEYYGCILHSGLISPSGMNSSLNRAGPLLLISASLCIAFRAGIWNLGGDGQFLLGAVTSAAMVPYMLAAHFPVWLSLLLAIIASMLSGSLWALIPALLKAMKNVNEVISTMMMSFLGVSLSNVLVKLVFTDPSTTVPETPMIPYGDRLPDIGDNISCGVLLGVLAVVMSHWMMTRTAFGLRLRLVGANPDAARHAGLSLSRLTVGAFILSSAMAGLAGAVEILGIQGNLRADWNPGYGLMVVPLVFLARFNGWAIIAFVFAFSVLTIGSDIAARKMDVPNYLTLVMMAMLMLIIGMTERWRRRQRRKR